jgi:uncharacterized membrane protein
VLIRTIKDTLRWAWPWLIAAVFAGGIIHITAVLAVPYLATRDAWARLSKISTENQLHVLPVADDKAPLPFLAPDIAYAFCRYNLSRDNVMVHTALDDATWSIAVSGRHGENFYFISGAEAKRQELRLLLTPRSRLAEEVSTEHSEEGDEQIIVITPGTTGVVMIRAPLRGPSFAADTLTALRRAGCKTVPALDPKALAAETMPVVRPAAKSRPAQRKPRRRRGRRRSRD